MIKRILSYYLLFIPGLKLVQAQEKDVNFYYLTIESQLNYFIQDSPILNLCLINISKISGEIVMNLLHTHPSTINRRVITEKPFYERPDKWLAKNVQDLLN